MKILALNLWHFFCQKTIFRNKAELPDIKLHHSYNVTKIMKDMIIVKQLHYNIISTNIPI